ncbi:MAG: transcription elongation factor GreA [Proteobacteria bacterium]|nr:transcription elongation factor GreA [Pseudomonadota bacterium]
MPVITIKGKIQLELELKRLIEVERPKVIRAIEEARAHGDLSENAEYAAAKERQSFVEGRISDISSKLATFEVIDPSNLKLDKIAFGATVTVLNVEADEKIKYQIVGQDEADISKGMISIMSPIARAMIGKFEGDIIIVKSPKGEVEYEILKIEYL